MNYLPFIIPIVSAGIGWAANTLLINLLFQSLPKRKAQLAQQVAKIAASELFSFDTIEQTIINPGAVEKIMPHIEQHIDHFLRVKLAEQMPVISMFIGDKTIAQLKGIFTEEVKDLFPVVMQHYIQDIKSDFDLEKMITTRLNSLPAEKIRYVIRNSFKKELRMIKIVGAITGFAIGLLQVMVHLFI